MDQLAENVGNCDLNDPDSDDEINPEQELNEWLGELDSLTVGLESVSSTGSLKPLNCDISAPRIDSYRFSMANLEDSQDVDLDAILGELCALETQCDQEIDHAQSKRQSDTGDLIRQVAHQSRSHSRSSSESNRCLKFDPGESELMLKNHDGGSVRTDSPDNDSAFSDTVSMLSSESSASSGASGNKSHNLTLPLGSQDTATRVKAEKIRMALEKMKEASVKKLFIKAFTVDGSTKSLLVDEKMTCGYVTRLLADKNHVQMDPKWAIVEHLPELYMERIYEDHELLVENLMLWTRDSKNKIIFAERPDKVQVFTQPEIFLLSPTDKSIVNNDYDDHARMILLEEFFSSNANTVPEVEGSLYLKSDSKKGWKKYHFVLRASGLYYWPREKVKSARDLICLATFDVNQIYYGVGWKKKYKAPTDFCFAIKHPRLQQPKSTKYIKFLCAEDAASLERWMVGIRIAKHGRQLMENYRLLMDDLAQDDLDMLAHARSCSISSIAMPVHSQSHLVTPTQSIYSTPSETSSGRHSRASSSSSSGCMSDGAPSSCENAFDSEFPMGTIKRKPSMKPSLPLTSITRQLKEVGETRDVELDDDTTTNVIVTSSTTVPSSTYTNTGTLTRRHSRRKSSTNNSSSNDDSSNSSGTLKRRESHLRSRGSVESIKSENSTPIGTPIHERSSPFQDITNTNVKSCSPITNSNNSNNSNSNNINALNNGDFISSNMTESITSLPPPPADPTLPIAESEEPLPPPPPELFRSNLSLDSLPPPPAPGELPVYTANDNISGSQLSLMSLPPPPGTPQSFDTIRRKKILTNNIKNCRSPTSVDFPDGTSSVSSRIGTPCFSPPPLNDSKCNTPTQTHMPANYFFNSAFNGHNIDQMSADQPITYSSAHQNQCNNSHGSSTLPPREIHYGQNCSLRSSMRQQSSLPRQTSNNSITSSGTTVYGGVPPYLAELQAKNSPQMQRKVNFQDPPPLSPKKTGKKITFNLPPGGGGQDAPPIPKKPPPPKRSEKTKLTSPKKLANSTSAPPTEFLKDLQRVMRKKWQVAQKCKLDTSTTPHEVLGFRDPPPSVADYRETNVSNWVQEHYGFDCNVYENVYTNSNGVDQVVEYATSPVHIPSSSTMTIQQQQHSSIIIPSEHHTTTIRLKRPPPPPPKRSETTQLTTSKLY